MALTQKFSTNLKTLRTKRTLSQQDLATKAGFSTSYISMLERGQRSPPLETIEALGKILKVAPVDMLR